jgi:Swt1-like HEPN
LNNRSSELRDFLFRGLMFEAEAASFQTAGIQVGADTRQAEERLLSEALSPFNVASRNNALEMARLYAVLHCFENEIRALIRETLEEKEGPDWIDKLPKKVKDFADSRQKTAFEDSWLEGEKSDLLGFVDFGQLSSIIVEKWSFFEDIVPSQHWLRQRMDELEKVRNFIAHNRMLLPSEFQRLYLYIADWNKAIGL